MNGKIAYLLLMTAVMAVSCVSVKENRMECPTVIRFSGSVNGRGSVGEAFPVLYGEGSGHVSGRNAVSSVAVDTLRSPGYWILAGKGELCVTVVSGATASTDLTGDAALYRDGMPADSLYALSESTYLPAETEEYMVKDTLSRQVAPVTLNLRRTTEGPFPFTLILSSGWNGFDRRTLVPVKGTYRCELVAEADMSSYLFNVPRQGDRSLVLEFRTKGAGAKTVCEYDFGRLLEDVHYDWRKKHLEPVEIKMDYANDEIWIEVNDWREQVIIENYVI